MADYRLTKTERNLIFEQCKKRDLEPGEFAWLDDTDAHHNIASVMLHRPTDYRFRFGAHRNVNVAGGIGFSSEWTPVFDDRATNYHQSRQEQLNFAARWLDVVKRECRSADLWAVDRSGCYAGKLPDGRDWKFVDAFTGKGHDVNPAIVHAPRSKEALIAKARGLLSQGEAV